jgi:hypothetical protein
MGPGQQQQQQTDSPKKNKHIAMPGLQPLFCSL